MERARANRTARGPRVSAAERYRSAVRGRRPAHLPQLDALRGLACLMVLVAHLKAVRGLGAIPDVLGVAGVGVFFVLSGFLITRLLVADREAGRGLGGFYNRRVARIFPAYFLTLAAVALFRPGRELGWASTFTLNLRYMTGLREYFHVDAGPGGAPPIGHLWSLCVEEHFYWLWPLAVALLPGRLYRALPWLVIAATPAMTAWLIGVKGGDMTTPPAAVEGFVWRASPSQAVGLCLGALLALAEDRLRPRRLAAIGLALAAAAAAIGPALAALDATPEGRLAWAPTRLHLACGAVFALGLAWPRLARLPGLRGVGRISYGLYLYHLPIYAALGLATGGGGLSPRRGLAAVALTFAVASASFRWVEAPAVAWMRRRQDGLRLGAGRVGLSIGTAATLALAVAGLVTTALAIRERPPVPRPLRFAALDPPAGAAIAYRWMGAVHHFDAEGFRLVGGPLPVAPGDRPRVAIVGDSRAAGFAVPADRTLAAVAEVRLRAEDRDVEVVNFGKAGAHAEEVLRVVLDRVLPTAPVAVVYAVGPDDGLPASRPFGPHDFRAILADPACDERVRQTIAAIRDACRDRGIPLLVVPLHAEQHDAHVRAVARRTRDLCAAEGVATLDEGAIVAPSSRLDFRVSRWDGHPDAECHRLYGEAIAAAMQALHDRGDLRLD